jgi:hypothetical protein
LATTDDDQRISEGERHSLGLEALHAALASHGIPDRMLGPSVPKSALTAAADRIRPAAVVVWSQVSRTASTARLRPLTHSTVHVIAAGPGWHLSRLLAGVVRTESLITAVAIIRDACDQRAERPPAGRQPWTAIGGRQAERRTQRCTRVKSASGGNHFSEPRLQAPVIEHATIVGDQQLEDDQNVLSRGALTYARRASRGE